MLPRCPECGLSYFPEQGYYVGAMIINYIQGTNYASNEIGYTITVEE